MASNLGKRFTQLLDETVTKSDVVDLIKTLVKVIKDTKKEIEQNTAQNNAKILNELEQALKKAEVSRGESDRLMRSLREEVRSDSRTTMRLLEEKVNELRAMIPELPDEFNPQPLKDEFNAKIAEVESKIPTLPEEKNIEGMLDELRESVENKINEVDRRAASGRGGVRRVFQPYVDRFQGDGSTKTFYLKREPLRTDTIDATGTDFPIALDPNTDFTVTGKAFSLTDAVPAPSNGAILIVRFYA